MNRILTYQPGEIRRLQDEALANRLADFINTWDSFRRNYTEPLWSASDAKNLITRSAEEEVNDRVSSLGLIVSISLTIVVLVIFFPHSWFWRIIGAIIIWVVWHNRARFKTSKEKKILLEAALKKREAEINNAEKHWAEAKRKYDEAEKSPEMCILNDFLRQEGCDLSRADLRELYNIVSQGYARTFAQAKQVLAQRKHNQRMQDIAEERRQQELRHQKEMEQEAARQRYAQERYNQEQIDIARENERSTRRMADAQEELAWIAKKEQEDKYWSQW